MHFDQKWNKFMWIVYKYIDMNFYGLLWLSFKFIFISSYVNAKSYILPTITNCFCVIFEMFRASYCVYDIKEHFLERYKCTNALITSLLKSAKRNTIYFHNRRPSFPWLNKNFSLKSMIGQWGSTDRYECNVFMLEYHIGRACSWMLTKDTCGGG